MLGASGYTFAEATMSQKLPDWIGSHVRIFNFFECVPQIVVPDNVNPGLTSTKISLLNSTAWRVSVF